MQYTYRPKGVCSNQILFEVTDDVVENVRFEGGCSGNLQGISVLVQGMNIEEVIRRLQGIRCGHRSTSCPDQFAQALQQAKNKIESSV